VGEVGGYGGNMKSVSIPLARKLEISLRPSMERRNKKGTTGRKKSRRGRGFRKKKGGKGSPGKKRHYRERFLKRSSCLGSRINTEGKER